MLLVAVTNAICPSRMVSTFTLSNADSVAYTGSVLPAFVSILLVSVRSLTSATVPVFALTCPLVPTFQVPSSLLYSNTFFSTTNCFLLIGFSGNPTAMCTHPVFINSIYASSGLSNRFMYSVLNTSFLP